MCVQHYPAENLLKNDSFKKWKCSAGEKQAVVVFQVCMKSIWFTQNTLAIL
jgi:XRCC1 N terminal domain